MPIMEEIDRPGSNTAGFDTGKYRFISEVVGHTCGRENGEKALELLIQITENIRQEMADKDAALQEAKKHEVAYQDNIDALRRQNSELSDRLMVERAEKNVYYSEATALEKEVEALTRELDMVKHSARYDLTGAYKKDCMMSPENRDTLEGDPIDLWEEAYDACYESETPLSVAMLDIDHFKKANDEKGHDFGDYVLNETVKLIMDRLDPDQALIRYGGEEFTLILPGMDQGTAYSFVDGLRDEISCHSYDYPGVPGDPEKPPSQGNITISCGLYTVKGEDIIREAAIARADKALYHAKENGRNRTEAWRPAE
ncbi:diguanylate cyclase [Candidatus Woesearchaeota archaeon]|nr:diguanylate cyclase [Candidatus Woesearchaeota archaeon]